MAAKTESNLRFKYNFKPLMIVVSAKIVCVIIVVRTQMTIGKSDISSHNKFHNGASDYVFSHVT